MDTRDGAIAELVIREAEQLAANVLNSGDGEALDFLFQAGWTREDIAGWMRDEDFCAPCIDNFESNNSLDSPNDCTCPTESVIDGGTI